MDQYITNGKECREGKSCIRSDMMDERKSSNKTQIRYRDVLRNHNVGGEVLRRMKIKIKRKVKTKDRDRS